MNRAPFRLAAAPLAAALLAAVAAGPAAAQISFAPTTGDTSVITVSATASVPLTADRATVFATLEASDSSGAAAMAGATSARDRVLAALRGIGYDVDRVQPWGLGFGPRGSMGPRMPGPPVPEERAALLGLRIPVEPLSRLDAVLSALAGAGVEAVRYTEFESSRPAAALEQATREAVRSAREQAAVMADAAGVTLGPLRSIGTFPDFSGAIGSEARFLSFGNGFDRGATLVPSPSVVRVTIFASWEIAAR